MYLLITAVLFLFTAFSQSGAFASSDALYYDVAVIGAGTGGTAAAIQAARMGMDVALIEESDWVGGQMTGAAVSTMDDVRRTRTGIYNEFITRVREHYEMRETAVNTCYWGSDTIAFEPWVGQKALTDMINEANRVMLFLKARVLEAQVDNGGVTAAIIEDEEGKKTIRAKVFIDATEAGDFIPLTGARYRSGNGISPHIDNDSVIQDITYVAVVKKYPEGLPEELRIMTPPPHYYEYLPHFREIIAKDGSWWPGDYPFNVAVHNAYRGMPDVTNPNRSKIDGGVPSTWQFISRTALNWANDYPGRKFGSAGMPARFLEDKKFRRDAERKAMEETLAFLYYMQTELGMEDWSVDTRQGYGGSFTNDWQSWKEMPEEFAPILRHFPPFPYIRESRRIIGVATMTVKDVIRDASLKRILNMVPESVALGEYPTDIHGLREPKYLDRDLGERPEDIPDDKEWEGGLFQIPLGVFIPEKIDGLLAAEKNISVSRVVNGSTRLQPVTMLTGQAVGALAAVAVREKIEPRDVRPIQVQWELLGSKDKLSYYSFDDVPPDSLWWRGVELAMLYGYMDNPGETIFGVDHEMHWLEVRDAFRRIFGRTEFPRREYEALVTQNDFNAWLRELWKDDAEKYKSVLERFSGEGVMTKGQLAAAMGEIKYIYEMQK
ncbi:FAD-dependent oxidoreductase [Synergistes jonesii]|uniref:FAD-dependent oxidoreductase n=1 Tax=Synergistes jonesii TaxID=2754 RepID=A0A073INQ8_9BACT|nr:FAD-dependent oxidoreductase [Synergistes jonesii]KEJ91988.1 FAD-dependent oxidoreductase [Synergistes jonesii]OFB61941.1 FAD-dependent oxidoreductase [Synergistes jonesii]OFB62547.1 FAD-dependent oxidoreductase [Synergistes jonesii]OFB64235.1 FAD-dependent oxidoreductase [Synergistes jonesii]OFB67382.1 FAD-dependent oxidoreductase [Synergistes jonesii]